MKRFYNLLFPVIFLLLLPGYLRRMVRRGNYRENFWQRFGYYSPVVRRRLAALPQPTWLQAVSVGEMLVALKLVAALRMQAPDVALVLSTTTTTGYTLAKERAPVGVEVVYTPIDLSGAVRRFFDVARPSRLVIVDGGLWPNQLWLARERGIETALVNARLSPRSERRFRRLPSVARALYGRLDMICVVEEADVRRWESLGVPPEHIRVTGSVKFDDATPPSETGGQPVTETGHNVAFDKRRMLEILGCGQNDPILLGGSTHPGEELALARVFLKLRARFPTLFLILAPRHVERAVEIQAAMEDLGLSVARRTNLAITPAPADVLLLDSTGELRDWYPVGTLVFVGKSLCAIGGQNPAEVVSAGVPVLFGPHMENFQELTARLLDANAAVQVRDANELEARCAALLRDPEERERLARVARLQIARHRGASTRTAEAVLRRHEISPCQAGNLNPCSRSSSSEDSPY